MIKNMEARSKLEALVNKWTAPPQSENLIVEEERYDYDEKITSLFRKIEFSSGKVKEETVFNFIERYYSGRMYYAFQSIYNRYSEIPEKDKENYLNPTKRWE